MFANYMFIEPTRLAQIVEPSTLNIWVKGLSSTLND